MIFEFVLEGLTIEFMSINTTFLTVYCFSDKNQSATSSDLNVRDGTERFQTETSNKEKLVYSLFFHSFIGKQREHIRRSLQDNTISVSSSTISRNISWQYYGGR